MNTKLELARELKMNLRRCLRMSSQGKPYGRQKNNEEELDQLG